MLNFQILISQISGPAIISTVLVLLSILLLIKNLKKDFYIIFSATILAMSTTMLLKYIFEIERPFDMLVFENDYRFPSGHATMASVIMSLGIYYSHKYIRKINLRGLAYICAILWFIFVSYSRLYLQVHYPIDIIVGGLIGIASVVTILLGARKRT